MKYKRRLVLWCAGALVLWIFLTGASEARDVEDILRRARERYARFRRVATDVTILQTATREGRIAKEKIYKKGEMFRIERDEGEVTVIRIYDGKSFWIVIPDRGIREELPLEAKRDAFLDKWFDFFGEKLLKVDRLERLGNRDCYVLAGRDNLSLWIDRETLALLKFEIIGDEERIMFIFSDFRVIEGWEIPLSAEMYRNGRRVGSSSLRLDLRTVLPGELFNAEGIELKDMPPCPFGLE